MVIDGIDRVIMQSGLSAVQQKNKAEEERELKERTNLELMEKPVDESEILSVNPKKPPPRVENSEEEVERVALSSSKNKAKIMENHVVQESYLGKNIDLKG